jgi:UDPglucose 6-dehydrogenase
VVDTTDLRCPEFGDDNGRMTGSRQVAVIGTGYVGLTVAACLAFMHHEVVCSDISDSRIQGLNQGIVPIVEEGLPELVREMVKQGRLRFTHSNTEAIASAEFVFLCLPTPEGADGSADLTAVKDVAREIAPHLAAHSIVINKSTVPVGTGQIVRDILQRPDVDVVSNPEFLSEGSAILNCLQPDRIVIGAETPEVAYRVAELYGNIPDHQCVITDITSAELIKYASNAYLATRLTFINSMATICEALGADIGAVSIGMGTDRRIGPNFLNAGPGWGGSCLPKDTLALIRFATASGGDVSLLQSIVEINATHTSRIVDKIEAGVGGNLLDKVVAIWGLTFKAGTNDLRNSPALTIAEALCSRGAIVRAYDPTVTEPIDGLDIVRSKEDAVAEADILLIATEWPEFATIDLEGIGRVMANKTIVDARNMLNGLDVQTAGFDYIGVGRGHLKAFAIEGSV